MWETKAHATLEKRLARLTTQRDKAVKQMNELLGRSKIKCGHCKHIGKIMDMVFIQPHWYESPHGCSGGDTWHQSKGQGITRCLGCGSELDLHDHPKLIELKYLFKEIEKRYEDR